jgi:hypothetical protein
MSHAGTNRAGLAMSVHRGGPEGAFRGREGRCWTRTGHSVGAGYLARSDQGRHLSSLKSASRLAKGLTAAGVGVASTAIIGLYWN